MEPTLEKGAHQCNTYISNVTYIGKKNPSMQYLHIKCNLHWKREAINAIPTYRMQFTLEKGTIHAIPTCQIHLKKGTMHIIPASQIT
jgi:hypothetical protein